MSSADKQEEKLTIDEIRKEAQISPVELNVQKFLNKTKRTWGLSEVGKAAISASMSMLSTKHGFYSAIPIICKGVNCPYNTTCELLKSELAPLGEQCPMEIARIVTLYEKYTTELEIRDEDEVDKSVLRDLINAEVMLARCDAKMAEEGDFVQMVAFAATESGDVLERPELSKTSEYREKVLKKKYEALQLLNSTRKDKTDTGDLSKFSPTEIVNDLLEKAKKFENVVEVDYSEDTKK